jgi:hypothetical protein
MRLSASRMERNGPLLGRLSDQREFVMARTRSKAPSLRRTAVALWHSLSKALLDPYRPELHYMRGPGPRWRVKHAQPANGAVELSMPRTLHAAWGINVL